MADVKTRILLRSDITARWSEFNPVLLKGEVGIEYNPAVEVSESRRIRIKIGDGITAWNSLSYVADYDAVVASLGSRLDVLEGSGENSIDKKIEFAINALADVYQEKLPEGAVSGKYLTVDAEGNLIWKSIADPTWANITGNIADNEALIAELSKKQNVISETNKLGAELIEESEDKKFVSASEKSEIAKVSGLESRVGKPSEGASEATGLYKEISDLKTNQNNYVEKEDGKSLINVDDITKLGTIAEGAQVNVIEGIQVDGVDVAVGEGKKVNITGLAKNSDLNAAIERIATIEGKEAGWNDKYTQEVTNNLLAAKANAADVYSKAEVYTKTEVDAEIAKINNWKYLIVDEIPSAESAEEFIIYLVKDAQVGYREYIKINKGTKELPEFVVEEIGDFHLDLSDYYNKTEVNAELAKKQNVLTAGSGIKIENDEISVDPEATKVSEKTFVFEDDLEVMYELGKYNGTLANKVTIPAAGKTFEAVWKDIFLKEENPKTTQPSLTVTSSNIGAKEAGTKVQIDYSTTFNAGSYTYGPVTNVTASDYKVTFNGETLTATSGTFAEVQVTDSMNLGISATFDHTEGAMPVTNIGNAYAVGQITAQNDKSANVPSTKLTGYRNMFFGTLTEKSELTSNVIRGLATKQVKGNVNAKAITIPVGALRVVFAVPSDKSVTSITDKNGLGAQIFSSFTQINVNVEGANNYDAIAYKVYYMDYANANDKANTYNVTVA